MSLPAVQTTIAKRLTRKLNDDYKVNLQVDKVQITLNGKIILKDFLALDSHNDTIFYGNRLNTYIKNPWDIDKNNELILGATHIDNLVGKIIIYKGKRLSNLDEFVKKIDPPSDNKNKNKKKFVLDVEEIALINSQFSYFDYNKSDPKLIDFKHIHAKVKDFLLQGSLLKMQLKSMQFYDYRGIQVQNISTDFRYDTDFIGLKNLKLDTDNSSIDMNLRLISKNKSYGNFNQNVVWKGHIEEAFLSTDDLSKLTNVFAKEHHFSISTDLNGTLNKLILNNFESVTDNNIQLDGKIKLFNITDAKKYEIQSNLKNADFSFTKLKQIMPKLIKNNIPDNLFGMGNVNIKGKLWYNHNLLDTDIKLHSGWGNADITLKMNELSNISKTQYKGHIKTYNFQLDSLLHQRINNITSDFSVNGTGLSLNSLKANLIGVVKKVRYKKHDYENLTINGEFKKKLFKGILEVADNDLEMDFSGLLDFSQPKTKVDFSAEICKANLYQLNWVNNDDLAKFTGNIEVKAQGKNIDDFIGKIHISKVEYKNSIGNYTFNNFMLTSEFIDSTRIINLISDDIVSGYIKGNYKFKHLPVILKNALGSVFANYQLTPLENEEFLNYNIKIHSKIVSLFYPKLKIAKNTYAVGKISSKDNLFKMRLLSPTVSFGKNKLSNVNLRIDNKNPLYNVFLKLDSISTSFYKLKNVRLLNTTINDTLYMKSKFTGGENNKDKFDLAFYYTMDKNQNLIFGLQHSKLNFKNTPWKIDPKQNYSRIFYNPVTDSLNVNDVGLIHRNEKLHIFGYKTANNLDFDVDLEQIDLSHITPDLKDFSFEGIMNGNIHLYKVNNELLPAAQVKILDFKFNKTVLGDLSLKINTLQGNNVFVDTQINRNEIQKLKWIGYIDLKPEKPVVNTSLLLQEFPIEPLGRLFNGIFENVRGNITGNVQIKGKSDAVAYDGKLFLNKFGLKVKTLNVDYQFDNRSILYLHNQTFELKKAKFFDTKFNTKAELTGVIKHRNFDKWYLNLSIDTDNMLVLDTPPDPQELYYGKAFVGGNTKIYGYVNRLKIDADMQTKPQTNFVITLNDVETIGEDDFVHILSKNEYKKKTSGSKKRHKIYEGLEMNFDLDITPDAQVEILLDQEFGSTLVAKGSGGMLLEINTNGRFNIWGDFTVLEGIYNFKYAGFIDKKFNVEPGSYISWEGDPYAANLDIKATYETFADPSVLIADQGTVSKKMPVIAIIYLKDKLTQPTINFDLEFPKANAVLKSQIEYILSDPDKKTFQVLSLLSMGSFIDEDAYSLTRQAREGIVETFSEKGLSILNALFKQDENFQVNLNYTGGEANVENNTITDPQVGLSLATKINKRVYINGKVAIPVGRYTRSSIVGDIEMEIYLDKNGNLIFRVFNKQTELEYLGQQEGYTQGVGVSYRVDFDTFKEILQKIGISVKTD